MKQLTEKQKKAYMDNPNVCPKCQSDEIKLTDEWEDVISVYEQWECKEKECATWWIETYTLTDVELI